MSARFTSKNPNTAMTVGLIVTSLAFLESNVHQKASQNIKDVKLISRTVLTCIRDCKRFEVDALPDSVKASALLCECAVIPKSN